MRPSWHVFPSSIERTSVPPCACTPCSTKYLKAVERGAERFDLDGKPAGEVTAEQREHAAATLKERFAAVAKQQRERREAEEAERRREEKLRQLVSKFGR